MTEKNRALFTAGVRAGLPIMLGYVPIGIAFAVMARQAGLSVGQTCLMSLTVYAGASQMMAAGMLAHHGAFLAIVLATFVLNLRHIIMSTCVMHRMEPAPLSLRLLAAFGVTDESFALFTTGTGKSRSVFFFLGIHIAIYLSWNLGTLLGALAMDLLPPILTASLGTLLGALAMDLLPPILTASLGVSLYAMFVSILMPDLPGNGKLALLVLLTAVCSTLFSRVMASSWALIVSTLLCAFAGSFFVELKEEADV